MKITKPCKKIRYWSTLHSLTAIITILKRGVAEFELKLKIFTSKSATPPFDTVGLTLQIPPKTPLE